MEKVKNSGLPAFPQYIEGVNYLGLSKREYVAIKIFSNMIPSSPSCNYLNEGDIVASMSLAIAMAEDLLQDLKETEEAGE